MGRNRDHFFLPAFFQPVKGSPKWIFSAMVLGLLGQGWMGLEKSPETLAVGLVIFAAAVFIFLRSAKPFEAPRTHSRELSSRTEWGWFSLILAVSVFMRFWRLRDFPPGLFLDQGYQGYSALRILREGYRPLFDQDLLKAPALFLYELAAWFTLAGPGELSSKVFFVLVSLAALPFVYWSFRELAGPRKALLAFFILGVMRWHVNLSRWGHFAIHDYFFMFSSLFFFLYGLRTEKRWAFLTSGFLLGLGMYYYEAYDAFPALMLVYMLYEFLNRKDKTGLKLPFAGMALLFLAVSAPLFIYGWAKGGLGQRMGEVSLFNVMWMPFTLKPLWESLVSLALMFNWKGDLNQRHNFHEAPMLDPMTGVLFVLGLFFLLRSWKKRENFYALSGLAVLSLPGVLSLYMPHALRLNGMVPFVALAAAAPLDRLLEGIPSLPKPRRVLAAFFMAGLPLCLAAYSNFHAYFTLQMGDPECWYWWDPVPTVIGRRILEKGAGTEFEVTNRCKENATVLFLAYPHRDSYKSFDSMDRMPPLPADPSKNVEYALESQWQGIRSLIPRLFPDCRMESLADPGGHPACYFYDVSAGVLNRVRGLSATYKPSGKKVQAGLFPNSLPEGPFLADFQGCVYLPLNGDYSLEISGNTQASVRIGEKNIQPGGEFSASPGFYGILARVRAPRGKPLLLITLLGPDGHKTALGPENLTTLPLNHGLLAIRDLSGYKLLPAKFSNWEQVLDYDYGYSFPFLSQGGLENAGSVRWIGELTARVSGLYRLRFESPSGVTLTLDGKNYLCKEEGPGVDLHLEKGPHSIVIDAPDRPDHLAFYWTPPGQKDEEVVPMEAFGTTRLE